MPENDTDDQEDLLRQLFDCEAEISPHKDRNAAMFEHPEPRWTTIQDRIAHHNSSVSASSGRHKPCPSNPRQGGVGTPKIMYPRGRRMSLSTGLARWPFRDRMRRHSGLRICPTSQHPKQHALPSKIVPGVLEQF